MQNIDLHCHRLQCQCPSHHLKQQRNGLRPRWVNSSPTSVAYMRRWTVSALVRVMAFCLLGAKSLPEPLLIYCQMDLQEHTSVKFEWKYKTFHSWKCIWTCCLRKWSPFCPGGDELKSVFHYYSSLKNLSLCTICLILTHRGPVDLRKWTIFNTILMPPKSWLSQEDLDACCEHSMVPMDS